MIKIEENFIILLYEKCIKLYTQNIQSETR